MKKVEPNFNFIEMEHEVLKFWEEEKCFEKLVEKNQEGKKFRFLDGPITANNPMGVHHAWGRTLKDIYIRYKGMNGYTSHYRNGFDAQGLWIEVEVEKELGFKDKKDIEKYGLDKFTKKCIERVDNFAEVITEQSKRLGQWMDWDNSYYTNSEENITSIWHFLKKCDEKGMVKQSYRSMPWCPRCGTSLSEHEMSGSYQVMTHNAVFFKLPLVGTDCKAVVWTTTPWTLSANVALAVNPEIDYVKVKVESDDQCLIMSKNAIGMLGDDKVEVVEVFKGDKLVGLEYETCFEEFDTQKDIKHRVIEWEDVSGEDGTGIVHIAPGCGTEDYELGQKLGLEVIIPIDDVGVIQKGFGFMTGHNTKAVAELVFAELEKRGKLYKVEPFEHSYPVCWRCKQEVVFKVVKEWYLDSDVVRNDLVEASRKVNWKPEFAGKRMEDWLNNMGNWAISRKRFYGLPLPIYPCEECNHVTVVGSREELRELAVEPQKVDNMPDIHRPWIDEIEITCKCGNHVKRVPDVGDCWLDAGIASFSTLKYFTDKEYWKEYFPAEWVTEMKEQIRLWFYSLLFMSVVLEGKAPYEMVLTYSAVVKEDGGKFSKTGTMIKFDEAAEKIGVDSIRYLYGGAQVNNDVRFGYNLGDEARRKLLNFWNIYVFFNTYAILDMPKLNEYKIDESKLEKSDKWLLVRMNEFLTYAKAQMDAYELQNVVKEFEKLVDDISNFYIRVNRKRFWKIGESEDKLQVYYLLYIAIKNMIRAMAPIIPFMTEEIWQNMVKSFEPNEVMSVHLSDYPMSDNKNDNDAILKEVEDARKIIAMGLMLRNEKQLKVRQPLSKMIVSSSKDVKRAVIDFSEIIKEELNVKEIEVVEDDSTLNDEYLMVNFKVAGGLFKEKIGQFKAKLETTSEEEMQNLVLAFNKETNESVKVEGFGDVSKEAFVKTKKPKAHLVVIKENEDIVALDTTLTEELIVEGMARDLVRTLQVLRKDAGFKVEQKINLKIVTDGELMQKVLELHLDKIIEDTLTENFSQDQTTDMQVIEEIEINGEKVVVGLKAI
ncbi:MAG: isoleucine--tRNA ligase [Oscillospiraceae bacterium]|nr:isoleucine--tRNA ligase [Oscillospiraceae bacterium]